jgi:uncharacterized protein YbaP (TraB family)
VALPRLRFVKRCVLVIGLCVAVPASLAQDRSHRNPVASVGSTPLLYAISKGNSKLYLLGTIHVGKPEFYPFADEVNRAIAQSDVIALEDDPSRSSEIKREWAEHFQVSATTAAVQYVPPQLMARVQRLANTLRIPSETINRLKPLGLDSVLTVSGLGRAGYVPQWGTESVLQQIAQAQHKPIAAVEEKGAALDQMANLPQGTQIQILEKAVSDIETGRDLAHFGAAATAWRDGDARQIEHSFNREIEALPPAARMAMNRQIDGRNLPMVARIESFLQSSKVYFVAVGMYHVVGPDGIAEILRRDGYGVVQESPSSSSKRP